MTLAYRIVNWKALYEVTAKGKPAKADTPESELRKSKLNHIRWKVHGRSLGPTYRKMCKMAWGVGIMMEPSCMGVFGKLLELAGDWEDPKLRGWILNEKKKPIMADQIAEMLDWRDDGTLQKLLDILCHESINWVKLAEFTLAPGREGARRGEKGREEGEKGKVEEPLYNVNETETVEATERINETERDSGREGARGGVSLLPPSALVAGSVSEISVSDSDSAPKGAAEIKKRRTQAFFQLCQIIPTRSSSDNTTFRDIFDQLEERMIYETDEPLFEKALEKARESCLVGRVPAAVFTAAMEKEPFRYVPVRRSIIRGKSDEYRH